VSVAETSKAELFEESNQAYHADTTAISHSMMEQFRKSIKGYRDLYVTGTMARRHPSEEMILGSALHCFLLEPDSFNDQYAVVPTVDGRTKDGKAAKAAFAAQSEGKTLFDANQMSAVASMASAVRENKAAAALLDSLDHSEVSIRWQDRDTWLQCKCRPDGLIVNGSQIIVDLKTASNPSPSVFARRANDFGYHRQAAHYQIGCETWADSVTVFDHVFIVVGNCEPFECFCYRLDAEAIDLGRRQNNVDLARLARCIETNDWRDPLADGINPLSLPPWAFTKDTNHAD